MPKTNGTTRAKERKCKPISVVALILALALLFQTTAGAAATTIPRTMDETVVATSETQISENIYGGSLDLQALADEDIVGEVTSLREENIKHFRLADGTTLAAVYDSPVHKKDNAGTWQDIQTPMTDNGTDYDGTTQTMSVKFSKNPKNGKLYTLKTDEGQIKWGLSGVKEAAKNGVLTQTERASKKLVVNDVNGCVTYEDILPGVTLQYFIYDGSIKENIIFQNEESAGPLQFSLQTNKFTVTLEDNIILFANADGETAFAMSAPWMMDSNGVMSDKITLGLTGSGNHYVVTVTPDAGWLEDATYPVTVDPAIFKTPQGSSAIKSVYVTSKTPTAEGVYNYGSVYVGREASAYENCRAGMWFSLPDGITSADQVVAANLYLTPRRFEPENSSLSITVNAHQITSSLNFSTVTWNQFNGQYSSIVSDSQVVTLAHKQNKTHIPFDITGMVQDWYQNGNNYGVAFVSENENSTYNYVTFHTDHDTATATGNWPTVYIQYVNSSGIEGTTTYHTAGNADVGTISVNDFNGNLIYMFEDVATNGSLFPVSISHVFDNSYRNEERYYHDGGYLGTGFRLNVYERIIESDVEGYDYQYLDADGTWHYFASANESLVYVDEYHPNRTITRTNKTDGSPAKFTLNDGSTVETVFTADGYLDYKRDVTNGKTGDIVYISGTKQIDKAIDGAGKVLDFTYTTINGKSYLQKITDPAGRDTVYAYTNGRLSTVTRPDGRTISLRYDSSGGLSRVTSHDDSYISITYYDEAGVTLRRVETLMEKGSSFNEGRKLTFTYATGETTVTDRD